MTTDDTRTRTYTFLHIVHTPHAYTHRSSSEGGPESERNWVTLLRAFNPATTATITSSNNNSNNNSNADDDRCSTTTSHTEEEEDDIDDDDDETEDVTESDSEFGTRESNSVEIR